MATHTTSENYPWWINRNFVLLGIGQWISGIGDAICTTTLMLAIVAGVGRSQPWVPLAVSGLLATELVPLFVVRPFTGVWVDRWHARNTMFEIDALRVSAIGVVIIGLSLWMHEGEIVFLALLYLAALAISLGSQIFGPAEMKLLAEIVPVAQRSHASGLNVMFGEFASILGPALASALFLIFGLRGALIIDLASFLISLLSLALLCNLRPSPAVSERQHALIEWRAGVSIFASSRPLRVVTLALVCAMFGIGALSSLNIFFITRALHAPLAAYGWIMAAFSVGSIIGGALGTRLAPRLGLLRIFGGSMVAVGICIVLYAWLRAFWPALLLYGIMGIPNALNNVVIGPLVLQETPPEYVGRVFSLLTPLWSGVYFLSILFCGALYSHLASGQAANQGSILSVFFTLTGFLVIAGGFFALKAISR